MKDNNTEFTIDADEYERYQQLIDVILREAKGEAKSDNPDFSPYEFASWGYESAYDSGVEDGATLFARKLRKIYTTIGAKT